MLTPDELKKQRDQEAKAKAKIDRGVEILEDVVNNAPPIVAVPLLIFLYHVPLLLCVLPFVMLLVLILCI